MDDGQLRTLRPQFEDQGPFVAAMLRPLGARAKGVAWGDQVLVRAEDRTRPCGTRPTC